MLHATTVVFDADGTLFDTFELIVSAYHHVADTYGLKAPSAKEIRAQLGNSLPDILRYFFPDHDVEELLGTNHRYFAANAMKSEAFAGVEELLQSLQNQGYKLAILTSGGANIHKVLQQHGLEDYFTSIVHHERINNPKPDPEGLLLACKESGSDPKDTVMIGDSVQDIEVGKNAGVLATIAVTHGFGLETDLSKLNPTYVAENIEDVAKLFRNNFRVA